MSAAEHRSSGNEPAAVSPGSSRYLRPVGDGTGNQPHSTERARLVSKCLIRGVDAGPHKDVWELRIYSPANDMVVTNRLIAPKGSTPRPTLILLPGADGKKSKRTWETHADLPGFFRDKHVQVLTTLSGGFSFYSDWKQRDGAIEGTSHWGTYVGKELPQVLSDEFHANERMAVAGLSMSGSGALDLAAQYPQTFDAAASFSGFPATSSPIGLVVALGVMATSTANPMRAWGYLDDPAWAAHDPARNVHILRRHNTKVFISAATGIPGPLDVNYGSEAYTWMAGAEVVSRHLTDGYARRARAAGVDLTYYRVPRGSHTDGIFEHSLHKAWYKVLAPAQRTR